MGVRGVMFLQGLTLLISRRNVVIGVHVIDRRASVLVTLDSLVKLATVTLVRMIVLGMGCAYR